MWDPDPSGRARIGDALDERSQWQYWAALAHPELEFLNFGVYGERTDEIAGRLEACADGADVLVVQGGINDIAQRRPTDRAAAHLSAMGRRGKELGLKVAIADVLPWNAGWPQAAVPIDDLNVRISALAVREEVPLLALPRHPCRPWATGTDARRLDG